MSEILKHLESFVPSDVNDLILELLASKQLPFNIVESKAFRRLVKRLNPNVTVPTRQTVAGSVLDRAEERALKYFASKLKKYAQFAATYDGWTGLKCSFWSLVLHALDVNYEMKVFRVGCMAVIAAKHSAEVIGNVLEQRLTKLGITLDQMLAGTSDAGGAAPHIAEVLNLTQQLCISHRLNTILAHLLTDVTSQLPAAGLVVDICKYFARLYNTSNQFHDQILTKLTDSDDPIKGLLQHCVTRWNSLLACFKSVKNAKDAIIRYCAKNDAEPYSTIVCKDKHVF